MPTCSICYERFTSPISLPCGHVFCKECIRRTVDSIKSCSIQHFCPTCRAPYSVLTIDPALVPPYLRPHILPPIRPVFFDDPTPAPASAASTSASVSASEPTAVSPAPGPSQFPTPGELGRAAAEVDAMRMSCATWRRRAEVHAAANTGLLSFARAAKEHALRMRTERDAARSQCALLKRKLTELLPELALAAQAQAEEKARAGAAPAPRLGLPVFLTQCRPEANFYDDPADMAASHFGPPLKRRKEDPERSIPQASPEPVVPRREVARPISEVVRLFSARVPAPPVSVQAVRSSEPRTVRAESL